MGEIRTEIRVTLPRDTNGEHYIPPALFEELRGRMKRYGKIRIVRSVDGSLFAKVVSDDVRR